MKFFQTLNERFPDADLTIRIKAKGGEQTISVMPASTEENDIQPIIITGNPEELDEQFFDLIQKPLAETVTAIVNLEEQEKSVKESASKPAPATKAKEVKPAPKKGAKKVVSKKETPAPTEGSLFEAPEAAAEESSTTDDTDDDDEPISDSIEE